MSGIVRSANAAIAGAFVICDGELIADVEVPVESDDENDRVLAEATSGGACVNGVLLHISNPHLPFGGVKQTGNGHREGGWEVFEFYSETKVGYVDYSGALQRAQIDNY